MGSAGHTTTPPGERLVEQAHQVAEQVLAPAATATDQADRVPQANLDALAGAGLMALACPTALGGQPVPRPVVRRVHELIGGACGATSFVFTQHHGPVAMLAASANTELVERWLDRLCGGQALAGIAFAHLRRPGPPPVAAEAVPGGYRLSGTAPWVTSWGMAQVIAVGAQIDSAAGLQGRSGPAEVVWCLVGATPTDTVRPSPPLRLSVMQASSTVRLSFDGLFVPSRDVVTVEALDAWRRRDQVATARPRPAVLGLAETCCRLLTGRARQRPSAGVAEASTALAGELSRCRARSYQLDDQALAPGSQDLDDHLAAMVEARAWGLGLAQRAAHALVAANGGAAMALDHPAQRLAREATFHSVAAQDQAMRAATLARLVGQPGPGPGDR